MEIPPGKHLAGKNQRVVGGRTGLDLDHIAHVLQRAPAAP